MGIADPHPDKGGWGMRKSDARPDVEEVLCNRPPSVVAKHCRGCKLSGLIHNLDISQRLHSRRHAVRRGLARPDKKSSSGSIIELPVRPRLPLIDPNIVRKG